MSQIFSSSDIEKATRAIKHKMISVATAHLETIELQDVARMQAAGLYDIAEVSHTDPAVLDLILSGLTGDDILSHQGPYLFHFSKGDKSKTFAFELINGFFEADHAIRIALYNFFVKGQLLNIVLDKSTLLELSSLEEKLSQTELTVWQSAAISCVEIIQSDLNYHLQAVKQSMQFRYDEGVNSHFNELLHLSDRTLLRTLSIADEKLSSHRVLVADRSANFTNLASIAQVCGTYLDSFTYLPIGEISFAEFLFQWLDLRPRNIDVWSEVWGWARARGDVPSIYSACTIFISRPFLIPKDKACELFDIIDVIACGKFSLSSDKTENNVRLFRQNLARHFTSFIKLRHPGASELVVGNSSWFLSHELAQMVGDSVQSLEYFQNVFLQRSEGISSRTSLQANVIGDSLLAILTRSKVDPWSFSILSLLDRHDSIFTSLDENDKRLERLQGLVSGLILSACAFAKIQPDELQLNIKHNGIINLAGRLSTIGNNLEYLSGLQELFKNCEELLVEEKFLHSFQSIFKNSMADQFFFFNIAKVFSGQKHVSFLKVWKIISDDNWLSEFFENASIDLSSSLFEVISAGTRSGPGQWVIGGSHIFAIACEKQKSSPEKASAMFLLTVLACVQSSSVSAIDRLLKGQNFGTLSEAVGEAIILLSPDPADVPPWVIGRMRSVKVALV